MSPAGGGLRPGIWVSCRPQEPLLLGAGPGELEPRPAAHSNRDSNPEPEQPVRGTRQKPMGTAARCARDPAIDPHYLCHPHRSHFQTQHQSPPEEKQVGISSSSVPSRDSASTAGPSMACSSLPLCQQPGPCCLCTGQQTPTLTVRREAESQEETRCLHPGASC